MLNAIELIDAHINEVHASLELLEAQRKILMKYRSETTSSEESVSSIRGNGPAKTGMPVKAAKAAPKAARKTRTTGVKEAVLGVLKANPTGIRSADIVAVLVPPMEEGSIRAALNGLKSKGIAKLDGKMWVLVAHDGDAIDASMASDSSGNGDWGQAIMEAATT